MHGREKAASKQGQAKKTQSCASLEHIWSCAVQQGVLGQATLEAVFTTRGGPERAAGLAQCYRELAVIFALLHGVLCCCIAAQAWLGAAAAGYVGPRLRSSPEVPTAHSSPGQRCSQLSSPTSAHSVGGQGGKDMVEGEKLGT